MSSLLDYNINNQIFVYQAEVYPNTELNEDSYRKKHGIKTKKIELLETHCSPKEQEWLSEYQEIVVETSTMTQEDWKKRNLFSVVLMTLHSFKLGFYLINYLKNEMNISGKDLIKFICDKANKTKHPFIYQNLIKKIDDWSNGMLSGKGRSILNTKYSDVYLDIEEIMFLRISENFEKFYDELKDLVQDLIGNKKWEKNYEIINEVLMYQNLRMPRINMKKVKLNFKYNIAEYMFYINTKKKVKLKEKENILKIVNTINYGSNYWEFTKKKLIWARKEDKIKNEIDYDNEMLEKMKKVNKLSFIKEKQISDYKVSMFDKHNKFKQYDSLEIKNNRKIH